MPEPAGTPEDPKARLLRALEAERVDNRWWTLPPAPPEPEADDQLTTARRRRAMADEFARHDHRFPNPMPIIETSRVHDDTDRPTGKETG